MACHLFMKTNNATSFMLLISIFHALHILGNVITVRFEETSGHRKGLLNLDNSKCFCAPHRASSKLKHNFSLLDFDSVQLRFTF